MSSDRSFIQSTVGKKVVMALSGLILVGFVIIHMLGNLNMFQGSDAMNDYAHLLKSKPPILWGARVVLLSAVLGHIWSALALTQKSLAARPIGYAKQRPQAATFASRTIRIGGVVLLVFIVFHLLHFTVGAIEPSPVPFSATDVYGNVVGSFSVPWVAVFYIVAMMALGLHLFHGVWASFRTLGLVKPSAHPMKRNLAVLVAVVVWLGFTAIPLAVLAGFVR